MVQARTPPVNLRLRRGLNAIPIFSLLQVFGQLLGQVFEELLGLFVGSGVLHHFQRFHQFL